MIFQNFVVTKEWKRINLISLFSNHNHNQPRLGRLNMVPGRESPSDSDPNGGFWSDRRTSTTKIGDPETVPGNGCSSDERGILPARIRISRFPKCDFLLLSAIQLHDSPSTWNNSKPHCMEDSALKYYLLLWKVINPSLFKKAI